MQRTVVHASLLARPPAAASATPLGILNGKHMNEPVLKYLWELSAEAKARITTYFGSEVEEFSFLIATLIATLQRYHRQNLIYDDRDPKQVAFGLMTKSANTLMAGFELALTGYMWEPPVLLRSALEGFATAWDIVQNKDRFATWTARKKFDSTDSISSLKKIIGPIGKMYGFMSSKNVHISPLNSSPPMLTSDSGPKFQFFGLTPPGKESRSKGEIYFALLVAHVCLQLTELVFHNYSIELETIEKIPGTDLVRTKISARHRRFVDAAMEHLKAVSESSATYF